MASIGAATTDDDGSKFVGTRRPIALQAMDDRFQWRINDRIDSYRPSPAIDRTRKRSANEASPGKKGGSVSRMR